MINPTSYAFVQSCAAKAYGLGTDRIVVGAHDGVIQVTIKFGPFRPSMSELAASTHELAQEMPCGTILLMIYVMPEPSP